MKIICSTRNLRSKPHNTSTLSFKFKMNKVSYMIIEFAFHKAIKVHTKKQRELN
ncbi:MAG: hypothetical protein MJ010_02130 [Paludibacteraceae bacterium]|nr:hypothetical protein [Paludibacteraceae bacterium]